MTSWSTTANGLNAYYLSTSQSSSSGSCSIPASTSATFGIRVWKRSSTGNEVEITQGAPVAEVTRYSWEGIQSSTWLCPEIKLARNDSIVIRVYISPDGGDWKECRTFTTEQLENAEILNSTTWTVYYYTYRRQGSARFYYGTSTYNSRIENFNYTTRLFLQPGEIKFNITAIYIPSGEINFTGNSTHLDIYFEAYYSDGSLRDIGAVCFLNCDLGYEACSLAQAKNCSVLTPPGRSFACSILNPDYYFAQLNNVSCTFYDPENPDFTLGFDYLNSSFVPVNFSIWASNYSSLVGEEFNLPIYIKNSGLFRDSYKVEITSTSGIYIRTENFTTEELHGDVFDPHAWQQTGPEVKSYPIRIIVLDASSDLRVCVKAESQQMLSQGGMSKQVCMGIKSQLKSMPELNLLNIFLLALIASTFIFKIKRKI
jgi:hypothetical protein